MTHRVAFFTKSKRRTQYTTSIVRALRRSGCNVLVVNMARSRRWVGRRLAHLWTLARIREFRPNAVIVFSGDIQEETLGALRQRYRTALLLDDFFPVTAPVTRKILQVDVFFHTMTGLLDEYRAAGVRRPVYLHSGVDPEIHRRVDPDPAYEGDVAFIGKAVYEERVEFVRALHEAFDLKVYGAGWEKHGIVPARPEVGVKEFTKVCASSRIVFGIDKVADQELYFSNRTWFVLGCGGFLLTRYVPGLERMFANHKHLVWYKDFEEAADQIRFYRENDTLRRGIAAAGHRFVHTHYPFDRMANNIKNVLFQDAEPAPLTDPGESLSRGVAFGPGV